MRNNFHTLLFLLILALTCNFRSYSQATCASPGTICPNPSFALSATSGTGLSTGLTVSNPSSPVNPPFTNNGCQLNNAVNPEWLVINVTSTGQLGFSFGACGSTCPQSNYLHWTMWPYSASTCTDITSNAVSPVACNYNCSSTGGTGMGTVPACASACNFQNSISVNQGEQYLILISNVAGVPTCVTFSSTGTAGLSCSPLTVPNATACPGQTVTTTASWPGTSLTTYSIYSPASPVPVVQASSVLTVSATTSSIFTVQATATNAFGQNVQATANFTLLINPTSTLSVASATDICYGQTITFSMTPSQGTFNVAGPCAGAFTPTTSPVSIPNMYSPTCNGAYTITAAFPTGCTGTVTAQVNIAPNNFITVTPTINVCQNGNANLVASMPTALNYSWTSPPSSQFGSFVFLNPTTNSVLTNLQPSDAGTYTVDADINYNSITCPVRATTFIDVVQTHTVSVPASYTLCEGESVSIPATVGGAYNNLSWSGPQGFNSTALTATIGNIACNQAGTYNFTAFFNNGVLSCPVFTTTNVQVVCVTPPVLIVSPSPICQYDNASVVIVGGGGAVSYYVQGPTGSGFSSTSTSTIIPNVQPNFTGIYTGTVVYAIGTKTCAATSNTQLTVFNVNPIVTNTPAPSCYLQNVNLYANSIGATSYTWAGPSGFLSYGPNAVVYYPNLSASGAYTVSTSYVTSGLTCYNSDTVHVSVNPILSFTLPSYLQACTGNSLQLTGPVGATQYSWSSSTGYVGASPSSSVLIFPSLTANQTGVYRLDIMDGPCPSSQNVNLDVVGPIQFTITPESRTTCPDTTFFQVGVSGGSQNYAYTWNPSTGLSSPTGSYVTAILAGTTIYNVTAVDIACPNQLPLVNSFTVTVNQPPNPDLQFPATTGCDPFCLTLDTKTQNQSAIITYDFGGVLKLQDTMPHPNYCLPGPGVYNLLVHLEGYNGCTRNYQYPTPFIVNPRSHTDIQWSPEVPSTTDNLVTFFPVAKSGTVVSYDWMFSGTGFPGYDTSDLRTPQRKYEDVGVYPVMLISKTNKGCVDTTIEYLTIRDELNVFIPNSFTPNNDGLNDLFQVKGLGFKVEAFNLQIFDRWGHVVFSTTDPLKGWDGTVRGQSPSEGVYVYKVDVIGANGEGRKEYMGHVTLLR